MHLIVGFIVNNFHGLSIQRIDFKTRPKVPLKKEKNPKIEGSF
jgi:hypothetical protein